MKVTLDKENRLAVLEQIRSSAGPSTTYFILTVLATVIASYGLVSDSTATVIGAMIVAPLMGPILGIAMGAVSEEPDLASSSLLAETTGVLLCVFTACGVALAVSPASIDFSNHEISARIHPTLYDMAVGFAAGLAGAYATVNTRISGSIAGVAIAVALVPPLSVAGLCAVGAMRVSDALWQPTINAFLLFLANFLTIEAAAGVVFLVTGFHPQRRSTGTGLVRHFGLMALLLIVMAAFLSHQLNQLLRERAVTARVRDVLRTDLGQIPGASIDRLTVRVSGDEVEVHLQSLSPQEVTAAMVHQMQEDLRKTLGLSTLLTVRTVSSVYMTAEGKIFEPRVDDVPDPRQVESQKLGKALEAAIATFPEAELVDFRERNAERPPRLALTVRSPYLFDPIRVKLLQQRVNELLRGDRLQERTLTVRSILSRDATADGYLEPADSSSESTADRVRSERLRIVQRVLRERVEQMGGVLIDSSLSDDGVPERHDEPVRIDALPSSIPASGLPSPRSTPSLASPSVIVSPATPTSSSHSPSPRSTPSLASPSVIVSPATPTSSSRSPSAPPTPPPSSVATPVVTPPAVLVQVTIQSPTPIDADTASAWQLELTGALGVPVRLSVDSRQGVRVTAP